MKKEPRDKGFSAQDVQKGLENTSKALNGCGNFFAGCGCLLTILITLPILILLFL